MIPAATNRLVLRAVRVRPIRVPLAYPLATGSGTNTAAPFVLLDLETEAGIVGRAYVFCFIDVVMYSIARLMMDLGATLVGRALYPRSLHEELHASFRVLAGHGITVMATAGIEMAAWDAAAKQAGMPLCRFLGAEPHPIPAYASLFMLGVKRAGEQAQAAAAAGFGGIKVKVGYPTVEMDIEVVREVRRAAGSAVQIMVDYNQSLQLPEALMRARRLEQEGLGWIEEPIRAADYEGHARIARETKTPIQLGENWWNVHDMAQSLAAGASTYAMPDVAKIGGVTSWLRAAALAEAAGMPISNHIFPEISAHLLAAAPTRHWLEYVNFANPILSSPLRIERGCASPSTEPGAGIEWNEDFIGHLLNESGGP